MLFFASKASGDNIAYMGPVIETVLHADPFSDLDIASVCMIQTQISEGQ